jgi:3-oxoacyl-(acyl-carrier-protein) synthase III
LNPSDVTVEKTAVTAEFADEIDAIEENAFKHKIPTARITGVTYHMPDHVRTIKEVEDKIAESSPEGVRLPHGMISRVTGVKQVHVMPDDWQASDLAVAATRKLIAEHKLDLSTIDLLIFASASQDLIEPATSHIVAAKLGINAPVMDVKNACNSFINGVEVANAFIRSGSYKRVLVVSGETPSRGVRWNIPTREIYLTSFPGFTMSDAGAAGLIENTDIVHEGRSDDLPLAEIIGCGFTAMSEAWDVGMLPTGGSMNPRGFDRTYFEIDGGRLFKAFELLGSEILDTTIAKHDLTWDDFTMIAVHQVALPYLDEVKSQLGIPDGKTLITLDTHGNIASASLPLQLKKAQETGMVKPGDLVALVGLAGGISIGIMIVRI